MFDDKIKFSCNVYLENDKKIFKNMPCWKDIKTSIINTGHNTECVITGAINDIIVVDFDKENGMSYYNKYKDILENTYTETSTRGYKHAYYKYDPNFDKKGINCDDTNIDILSNGCFCILSKNNNGKEVIKMPNEIKEFLLSIYTKKINNVIESDTDTVESVDDLTTEDFINAIESNEIDEKYYSLLNLLSDNYFNHYDKWIKPAYALYYCNEINNDVAFNTWIKLLKEKSKNYNYNEAFKVWNKIDANAELKFKMASIKKIVSEYNKESYNQWVEKYTIKQKVKAISKEEEEEKALNIIIEIMNETFDNLNDDIIRNNNNIEFNNLVLNDHEIFTPEIMATLIKQTIIRAENNGNPMFYVKEIIKTLNKGKYIKSIKFTPRDFKVFKDKYYFKISDGVNEIGISLLKLLKLVKPKIVYKNITLEPFGALNNDMAIEDKRFNLFNGYLHKYDKNFKVNMNIVNVWTNHIKEVIADNDIDVYNHLMNYFKHILLRPEEKTGLLIIIKGLQGAGKNSPFDIFCKFVIGNDVSLTTPKMDLITGRFNSIRQSLIMCVLDEAVDNKDKKQLNEFKNLITSESTQIEYKGKEPITIPDFCNYIILSNNDFSSFIEESDRRSICLLTNDKYVGNRRYFIDFFKTLGNLEAGKHIFHYLINDIITPENWHPQDTPKTSYKQELKQMQANSVIKFFLSEYDEFVEKIEEYEDKINEGIEVEKYTNLLKDIKQDDFKNISVNNPEHIFQDKSKELFDKYVKWCESNKIKCMSSKAFATCSKNIIINYKTSYTRFKVYSYKILKEGLKQYL